MRRRAALGILGLLMAVAAACSGRAPGLQPLPGDPERGRRTFDRAGCAACHDTGERTLVGPGLKGFMDREVLPDGRRVTDANVRDYILRGGTGPRGAMPSSPFLADRELADLVAFLRTLR